jgi:hypothetical protein
MDYTVLRVVVYFKVLYVLTTDIMLFCAADKVGG